MAGFAAAARLVLLLRVVGGAEARSVQSEIEERRGGSMVGRGCVPRTELGG